MRRQRRHAKGGHSNDFGMNALAQMCFDALFQSARIQSGADKTKSLTSFIMDDYRSPPTVKDASKADEVAKSSPPELPGSPQKEKEKEAISDKNVQTAPTSNVAVDQARETKTIEEKIREAVLFNERIEEKFHMNNEKNDQSTREAVTIDDAQSISSPPSVDLAAFPTDDIGPPPDVILSNVHLSNFSDCTN